PLPRLTVAELATVPQSAKAVAVWTWMVGVELPPASVAKVQLSDWAPRFPVMEHPDTGGTIDQLRAAPCGSGSLTTTLLAVPLPALATVTSKPMVVPALTGPAGLATLLMVTLGHSTWTEAMPGVGVGPLPRVTVAELLMPPQSANVVAVWTW